MGYHSSILANLPWTNALIVLAQKVDWGRMKYLRSKTSYRPAKRHKLSTKTTQQNDDTLMMATYHSAEFLHGNKTTTSSILWSNFVKALRPILYPVGAESPVQAIHNKHVLSDQSIVNFTVILVAFVALHLSSSRNLLIPNMMLCLLLTLKEVGVYEQ